MRPVRLDIEGFGTFRQPVVLDFSDADYFALVGPTGSGKTTVIDAICFALYGAAPRWPRKNMISLAMAPSTGHTRVSLVFESSGRRYAAVRVLARAAKGQVNTKQARLLELPADGDMSAGLTEILDEEISSLADNADEVVAAIEKLLGLTWEHFIQCVVLPQGDFARFLHAAKGERQDLLVSLLGLELYGRIGQRATQISKEASIKAQTLLAELGKYAGDDDEAEAAGADRVSALLELETSLPAAMGRWTAAGVAVAATTADLKGLDDGLVRTARVVAPQGLSKLTDQRGTALAALKQSRGDVERCEVGESKATDEAEAAGEVGRWESLINLHDRALQARTALEVTKASFEVEGQAASVAKSFLEAAMVAQATARSALEATQAAHRADDLAQSLVAGGDCPVCLQTVIRVPDRPRHQALDEAQKALDLMTRELKAAQEAWDAADRQASRRADERDRLEVQIAGLDAELEGGPDLESATKSLQTSRDAASRLGEQAKALRAAREQMRLAETQLKALDDEWNQAGQHLQAARDLLAALEPAPLSGDHAIDWPVFVEWAARKRAEMATRADGLRAEHGKTRGVLALAQQDVLALLEPHDIAAPTTFSEASVSTVVGQAVTASRLALERLTERRAEAADMRQRIAQAQDSERVHKDLGQLLNARNFERWMIEEALTAIVLEASSSLRSLSGGQFELSLDDKQDLLVIDHNDASASRPVQTLSGGETFQASLALALALSSQIASLSSVGAGQLDTILLDEGFGTLDAATLDVVAATLEQLSGGGERTVGVVTHVAALAERVPVRFEVSRQGANSTVDKVRT